MANKTVKGLCSARRPNKEVSYEMPLQGVWIKLPVLLELLDLLVFLGAHELLDVRRKLSLCRNDTTCLTFFCARTLAQVFPCTMSEK